MHARTQAGTAACRLCTALLSPACTSRAFAGIPKLRNLLPEDAPQLKEWKERESRVVKEQMARGKLADARTASSEKVRKRAPCDSPSPSPSPSSPTAAVHGAPAHCRGLAQQRLP